METNRLIAEFMGWEYDQNNDWYFTPHRIEVTEGIYDNEVPIDYFEFHTSWDWLMPVVDKIERTSTDNKDNSDNFFNVTIEVFECNINGVDADINICENGHTKRKATYNAVVRFIKWYNENN